MNWKSCLLLLGILGLATACEGEFGVFNQPENLTPGSTASAEDDGDTPPGVIPREDDEEMDETCKFINPGETPMRRLTVDQYNNVVQDLFPDIDVPRQDFVADEKVGGFDANVVAPVGGLLTRQYQGAAEAVAQLAIDNTQTVVGCDVSTDSCARGFIEDLARKAFRRPPSQTETDRLFSLYETGRTNWDASTGIRLVIEGVLQSPKFLYALEYGETTGNEVVPLSDHERASRLSFFLWNTMPDQELRDAADAGKLSSPDEVREQARRMLQDPRARQTINDVYLKWLRLGDIAELERDDPAFNDDLKSSMEAETRAFIDHVMWEDDARIKTLLNADYTFVDASMADIYGVEPPSGDGMVRIDLPPERRGLLTHPSILTRFGEGQMPVHRGKFVQEAFLCTTPPEPPEELVNPPDTYEGQSQRERVEDRMAHDGCKGCHALMDPIGLAFDQYDHVGRWRTEDEHGNTVDDTGKLISATGETEVDGVAELAQELAGSEEVQSCVSKQFFRYAFARSFARGNDACTLQMMTDALETSGDDMRELLVAVTTTDAFLYRRAIQ